MGKKIPLGAGAPKMVAVIDKPKSLEEQVAALQRQVDQLTAAFHAVNSVRIKDKRHASAPSSEFADLFTETNRDGLPVGLSLAGQSLKGGLKVLIVEAAGYRLDGVRYDSLSAAAGAASGVRRSGWSFWKLADGSSVKEVFGKR